MGEPSRLMAHMVAGYPDRASSLSVARAILDGGAACLELQFPFSDPTADGPDIQAACAAALAGGFTVSDGFRLAAEIRSFARLPLYVMAYANLLVARGVARFLAEARDAGAAGIIAPDLPPGYDEGLFAAAERAGLSAMPVLSPSMSAARLREVGARGAPEIYATLRGGTTGPATSIGEHNLGFLRAVAAAGGARPPRIFAGFGVSRRDQVVALAPHVHAAVVGSVLVREVAAGAPPYPGVRGKVRELAGIADDR